MGSSNRFSGFGIISGMAAVLLAGLFCFAADLDASSPFILPRADNAVSAEPVPASYADADMAVLNYQDELETGFGQPFKDIVEEEFYLPKAGPEPAADSGLSAELNLDGQKAAQCGIQAHALAMRTGAPLDCSM